MKEVKKAAFSFKNYKISKFSLMESPSEMQSEDLSVNFKPSGKLFKNGTYALSFEFTASLEDNKYFIAAVVEGIFQFDDKINIEDVPSFFYVNSIAIIFPYLRAFVTTLTAVANLTPLILPTLNLTALEKDLRENTTVEF